MVHLPQRPSTKTCNPFGYRRNMRSLLSSTLLLILVSVVSAEMKDRSLFVPSQAPPAGTLQSGGEITTQAANPPRYINVGYNGADFNYQFNPTTNLRSWAASTKVFPGDFLVFNYPTRTDEVYQFYRQADYEICNYARAVRVCKNWDGAKGCKVKAQQGTMYFASGMLGRCQRNQKVAVKVKSKPYTARKIVVGKPTASFGWPWNPQVDYNLWMQSTKIYVGDKLVFKYAAYMDEVYIVPTYTDYVNCKYDNYVAYCNATDGIGDGCFSSAITATPMYFVSGSYSHCFANNQRLAVKGLPPPAS